MYYVLKFGTDLPKPVMITEPPNISGVKNPVFDRGVRTKEKIPVFDLVIDKDGQGVLTDLVWALLRGLTVSARFKEVLDRVGVDNVDYYPVRIVNEETGDVRDDYFEANVIGVIDCLNRDESEITFSPRSPGMVREIAKMVVDEKKCGGELLFRLQDVKGIVMAHEKVKKAVEKAKLTGVVFYPVDEFTWP